MVTAPLDWVTALIIQYFVVIYEGNFSKQSAYLLLKPALEILYHDVIVKEFFFLLVRKEKKKTPPHQQNERGKEHIVLE